MPADLTAIRQALKAALDPIEKVQVSAYILAQPTPPAIEIAPGKIEYDKTFGRGTDEQRMVVRAFVGATTDIGAQQRLDGFLAPNGDSSIKARLEADATLGGAVDDVHVTDASGYRIYDRPGRGPVLGAEWNVRVIA